MLPRKRHAKNSRPLRGALDIRPPAPVNRAIGRNGPDAGLVRLGSALRPSLEVIRVLDQLGRNEELQEPESRDDAQAYSVVWPEVGATNLPEIRGSIRSPCIPPQRLAIVPLGDPCLVGRVPGRRVGEDDAVPVAGGGRPIAKVGADVHARAELVGALRLGPDECVAGVLVDLGLSLSRMD